MNNNNGNKFLLTAIYKKWKKKQIQILITKFAFSFRNYHKLSHWPKIKIDKRLFKKKKKKHSACEKLCHFIKYFDLLRFATHSKRRIKKNFQSFFFLLTLDKNGQYICWLLHVKYPVYRTQSPDTEFAALA